MSCPTSSSLPEDCWDAAHMADTLLTVKMPSIMKRTADEPPHSPLYEYVQSQRLTTPATASESLALSIASEDSLDSMLTTTSTSISVPDVNSVPVPGTDNEAENNHLIYRLCRSLYKKAIYKTEGGSNKCNRSARVPVDTRHEHNMFRVMDWMPLLHLFDPKSFYAYRETGALPASGANTGAVFSFEVPAGLQRAESPTEASRRLLDELEVEKLSGGNSNHVYRLCHPHYPEKSILLRVYGGGDDEAIDRYRDVAAMKQVSKAQLAPAVLHTFKWGRVEEFMDNVATGTTDMLISSARLLSEVYEVLHKMHQLPAEPFLPEAANKARFKNNSTFVAALRESYDGPKDYLTKNAQRLTEAIARGESANGGVPAAFGSTVSPEDSDDSGRSYYATETEAKIMEEICPTAFERSSLRFLRLTSPSIKASRRSDFVRFITSEIMHVRGLLQRSSTPIVFSHNDLNPANILLSWRKVPKQFRPSPPVTSSASGSRDDCSSVCAEDDENDEVTSEISQHSSLLSRQFVTKKGHHKNLVELKGIVFIDFEYSDANYRAIDLGNTLCELDYDYSRGTEDGGPGFIKYLRAFPPADFADDWADKPEHYPRLPELIYHAWQREQTSGAGSDRKSDTAALDVGASCLQAVKTYFQAESRLARNDSVEHKDCTISQEQLTEVFLGMLATQLYWSLWSFTMACNPDNLTNQTAEDDSFAKGSSGLDYVRYGDCRLKEYLSLKTWMAEHALL